MFARMKGYLAWQAFADDQLRGHFSRAFKTLLLNMLVVLALAVPATMFLSVRKQQTSVQLLFYLFMLLTAWALAQRGRIKLASVLFVAGNWAVYTVVVLLFSAGISSIDPIIYVSIAVIAGVLLGPRAAVLVAVLSAMVGLGKMALDVNGYVSPFYRAMRAPVAWIMLVFALILAVIPLNLVLRSFVEALAQARQELDERKKTEVRLRESQDELRAAKEFAENLLQTANTIVVGLDLEGTITIFNDAAEKITGYRMDELEDRNWFEVIAPKERYPDVWEEFSRRTTGGLPRNFESPILTKSGEERYIAWQNNDVRDRGRIVGTISFGVDITERKRLEEQLRQSQKMEAVGQLAGGVAHDFNNLLQVILGNADLARSQQVPGTPAWDKMDEVRKAAERAADLVRQLLAFSRRQVIQPVNVDLNDLIQGALKMLRRVIGEHIELRFVPGDSLGTVCVDKGQIEQVLMNLCVNARDAMARGGNLTIETENATVDAEYRRDHPWAAEGRYVLMSVTDTGRGMDAATRARIFEPFFTTKGVGQGTGLGLATVYGIVKQHNGLLHVYSEPEMGTVFKVYLPIVESPAEEAPLTAETPPKGGTETILVAEDEPFVLNLVAEILSTAGYTVLTACDGKEALCIFDEHSGAIDLVVLDVMMPGLSGREVMDQINARHSNAHAPGAQRNLPFLFSSGYNENAIHTDFVIHEGLRLIQKPYSRTDLLREVRQILDAAARPAPDSAEENA